MNDEPVCIRGTTDDTFDNLISPHCKYTTLHYTTLQ
jgi:hypothetical protein